MTLSDTTKTDRLFKGSQDRKMTSTDKAYYEETASNVKVILGNEVWLESIDSTPATAISDGTVWMQSGWMHEDTSVANEQAWFASGTSIDPGNWIRWIPPKCGQGYTIKIYQSGSGDGNLGAKITDANLGLYGGVFDYQTGVLWWQDSHSYTTPFYISGYRYSGALTTKSQLDAYYQQSGAIGGISSWYDLSTSTGITPFGGSVSVSGTQAETISVLGYSNISSQAKQAYDFSSNSALVKNGFAQVAHGQTISHGIGSIPKHVSVVPSGASVNFGATCKVDSTNITVYLTALGTRDVFWSASL